MILKQFAALGVVAVVGSLYLILPQGVGPTAMQSAPATSSLAAYVKQGLFPEPGSLVENEKLGHEVFEEPEEDEKRIAAARAGMGSMPGMQMGGMKMDGMKMDGGMKMSDAMKMDGGMKMSDAMKMDGSMKMSDGMKMDGSMKMSDGMKMDGGMKMSDGMKMDGSMKMSDGMKMDGGMKMSDAMKMDGGMKMRPAEHEGMAMKPAEGHGEEEKKAAHGEEEEKKGHGADAEKEGMGGDGLRILPDHAKVDREIKITMREWGYSLGDFEVKQGERIRLTIRNEGQLPHEFMFMPMVSMRAIAYRLERADWNLLEHDAPYERSLVMPGETFQVSIQIEAAGSWMFMCMFPYHMQFGMMGQMATPGMAMKM
jgi:uncharacterized cupredoxin-like copper-binding protein